jgi:lysophospholipase L1-like esterase
MNYLALGDSYTIGEAVALEENWPYILVKQLKQDGYDFQNPEIIAVTGWRTDELIAAIKSKRKELDDKYDLVSILIGVNNQYQKKNIRKYKREFKRLIKMGLSKSKYEAEGMFVVSIPDYGVSDFAKEEKLENVAEEVAKYNKIAAKIAMKYNVPFYNITPASISTEGEKNMFAEDKLHPSAAQYQLWLDVFYDEVKAKVEKLSMTE